MSILNILTMKKALFLFSFLLIFISCSKPKPGSDTTTNTTLNLYQGYLGLYEEIHQPQKYPIKIVISVDNLKEDLSIKSNFKTFVFNRDNDGSKFPENYRFNIEVPQSGSFAITVTSEGTTCFDHCNTSDNCEFGKGMPMWREMQAYVNSNSNSSNNFSFFYDNPFIDCF